MSLNTLYPFTYSYVPNVERRIGRSKKVLRPVVTHDGRVFVARYEGRQSLFFGATAKEALKNLQAGGQ